MARALIVFVPLLLLVFFSGTWLGRNSRRREVERAADSVRPLIAAARSLAAADWVSSPNDTAVRVAGLELALEEYDDAQRRALS
jgi:hypothetical protein